MGDECVFGLQLDEGDVRRLANLARLTSMLMASKALPVSVVKASLCLILTAAGLLGVSMN